MKADMESLREAANALAWSRNGVGIARDLIPNLLPYAKVVGKDSMPEGCETMCVDGEALWVCAEFLAERDLAETVFLLAHEDLHPLLGHLGESLGISLADSDRPGTFLQVPGKEHEAQMLNCAQDVVINEALTRSGVGRMPQGGLLLATLPHLVRPGSPPYAGALESLEIYTYLMANSDPDPKAPPSHPKRRGHPKHKTPMQREVARAQVREASGIGKGSAIADALAPPQVLVDWRDVLRDAFENASVDAQDRSERSFARPARRQHEDVLMPGMVGTTANVACIVDVSGSVGADWAAAAGAYVSALLEQFNDVKCWFATHTSETCFAEWLTDESAKQIDAGLAYSGGTDVAPTMAEAHEVASKLDAGHFDVVIHFTDGELPSWPAPPAPRFVVGLLCGRQTQVPVENARVIPCATK